MIAASLDCPDCGRPLRFDAADEKVACECGHVAVVDRSAIHDGRLERCPLCGTREMYLQKDFPHRIGVALVVAGVALATYFWANYSWIGTFGTLFLFGAVDFLLFYTRKDVTVCYRCLCQFRNAAVHPDHRAFDLAIGERFRQERKRKELLRHERADG